MAALSPGRRRAALLIVVVGGALLVERVVALTSPEVEVVSPRVSASATRNRERNSDRNSDPREAASSSTGTLQLDRLDARAEALREPAETRSLRAISPTPFDPVAWPPAVKVASTPAPAPAAQRPVAPAFPYQYMGGMLDDGVRTAFFTQAGRVLSVKAHDTVDAVYRVDQMTETEMTLTYLPLEQTLVVPLGAVR